MPHLRSGVRRARAAPVTDKQSEPPPKPPPRGRGRGRPRTRLTAKKSDPPLTQLLVPETLNKVVEVEVEVEEEGVGLMGDERVGVSANKDKGVAAAAVPEEDANSPPLPERVCAGFVTFCICGCDAS